MLYIVPKPKSLKIKDEKIKISTVNVVSECPEILRFTESINDKNGDTVLKFVKTSELSGEQYRIVISESGIEVRYGETVGAYRAFTTLKQILSQKDENLCVNCLDIYDCPDIANRGYMLDISRGKIPSIDYLKELVVILSDLKYNQLQLYMESLVYEYKNFPEYWKDTEPLTREEIKELNEYCKQHYIALVPNQNGFGHMGAWLSHDELSHLAITKEGKPSQTLNPLLSESLELLDKIYDGYFDSFSSDIVNIGMDEPFELGMSETKEECEKYGIGKVYTDYLNKVVNLISDKYGKTSMFWDDIVFKHPKQLDNIPKSAIVMEWGYEGEQHFDRNCQRLKDRGLRFYVCPGTSMWGSFTGRTNNAILNISNAAECGKYYNAEGFLLTEWGDGGHPQFASTTYYPLVFGGYVSWNAGDHNTEIAYEERRNAIEDCKKFLDDYIYHTKKGSLSDIVYRMGNFYLLENKLIFNNTELVVALRNKGKVQVTDSEKKAYVRVAQYMEVLKAELNDVEADETAVREIKSNCDMVIIFAKIMSEAYGDMKDEAMKMCDEFSKLWDLKNHKAGKEIFINFTKKIISE